MLGVVTSDNYAPTLHCLKRLGIDGFFALIFSADRVCRPKPDPESALAFCRMCGLTPDQLAMVGDSGNEMRFARNSGMTGILFRPDGWDGPLPDGAHVCLRDLHQLPALLRFDG